MTPSASQTKSAPDPPPSTWGIGAIQDLAMATQTYFSGMSAYVTDFFVPFLISTHYFKQVESERIFSYSPMDTFSSYMELLDFNLELANKSITSALDIFGTYSQNEAKQFLSALFNSFSAYDSRLLDEYAHQRFKLMNNVVYGYPKAIEDIGPEFGFHFERGKHELVAETDRFCLYQVAPSSQGISVHKAAKPVLIIPPYVLGANILCFLPGEKRSYVHSFADKGIPTYIRILKNIETSEPLQIMTPEDDAKDTRLFCEAILKRNGKQVTLNGYCQGGYNSLCDILSGELDGLVDAFISCVAPMDGTRSKGLAHFLNRLPKRFNDLAYGTKTLPNGNKVADGKLMGWVYRLKSITTEQPLAAFYNNMLMVSSAVKNDFKFSKVAAALNHWLLHERSDLPMDITKVSFAAYNVPITKDGILPIKLFGRKLDLKRIKEKKIPWLICYGVHDNLVEPDTALAPLDHVQAEVTPFPKGHVAIATSWSSPNSACALDSRFGEGNWRGPVRFHLDLDESINSGKGPKSPQVRPIQVEKSQVKLKAEIEKKEVRQQIPKADENAKEVESKKSNDIVATESKTPKKLVAKKTVKKTTSKSTETQKKSTRKKATTTSKATGKSQKKIVDKKNSTRKMQSKSTDHPKESGKK